MRQFNRLVLGECVGISVVTYSLWVWRNRVCSVWIISAWLSYHILDSRNKDEARGPRFLERISKNRGAAAAFRGEHLPAFVNRLYSGLLIFNRAQALFASRTLCAG